MFAQNNFTNMIHWRLEEMRARPIAYVHAEWHFGWLVRSTCVSVADILMGAGIVLFGIKAHEQFNAAMHGTAYLFTWAYFTGISGVLAGFLSGVCYSLERCFTRTKADDGYLRGHVYWDNTSTETPHV